MAYAPLCGRWLTSQTCVTQSTECFVFTDRKRNSTWILYNSLSIMPRSGSMWTLRTAMLCRQITILTKLTSSHIVDSRDSSWSTIRFCRWSWSGLVKSILIGVNLTKGKSMAACMASNGPHRFLKEIAYLTLRLARKRWWLYAVKTVKPLMLIRKFLN